MPTENKHWFVYAIECENKSVYIGQTEDVINRWNQHLSGRGANWTKKYKPVRLFYLECFDSFKEALLREKELKKSSGRRMLKQVLTNKSDYQADETLKEVVKRIMEEKGKK